MERSVIVIGAGAAGLAAAEALLAAGASVRVLEAGSYIGGRIRALEGFCGAPVELGAEEIHGTENALYELARRSGLGILSHDTADDAVRVDGKICFLSEPAVPELSHAIDWMSRLQEYSGPKRSVLDQLILEHFPLRVRHYLDSRLGVEHGASLDRLAMNGFHNYEQHWEAREHNYTIMGRYIDVLKPLIGPVESITELNTPVTLIDWSGRPTVRASDGRSWQADSVVITSSVAVLRAAKIGFSPDLPASKGAALRRISMDGGMKIILKFRKRFWPNRMYFLHTDGFLPQFWSTCHKKCEESRLLTAFIGGGRYEELRRLGVDPVSFAIGELESIFGTHTASRYLEASHVEDWNLEPYIGGLYSYIGMEERSGDRAELAAPLAGKLFFAGEATDQTGNHGTVHGALESGRRAAQEVLSEASVCESYYPALP